MLVFYCNVYFQVNDRTESNLNFQGFSNNLIRKFAYSMLLCLRMLHREKIIHCDFKPVGFCQNFKTFLSMSYLNYILAYQYIIQQLAILWTVLIDHHWELSDLLYFSQVSTTFHRSRLIKVKNKVGSLDDEFSNITNCRRIYRGFDWRILHSFRILKSSKCDHYERLFDTSKENFHHNYYMSMCDVVTPTNYYRRTYCWEKEVEVLSKWWTLGPVVTNTRDFTLTFRAGIYIANTRCFSKYLWVYRQK